MVQKGIERVKTGCTTCKIRKVKCDEGRPSCTRCLQTGRKCDGYTKPPSGSYSWSKLLNLNTPLPLSANPTTGLPDTELRALAFFSQVAAPSLSKPLDSHFWTHIVLQMSHSESAAKHAVLSISALYEDWYFRRMNKPAPPSVTPQHGALWHYNKAVTFMQKSRDRNLMLVMCLMFVCIEFLRDNHQDAISHCRHGINILNEAGKKSNLVRQYIEPAFCRLSVFPFFFGASPETFPIHNIASASLSSSTEQFSTAADAHAALNPLLVQCVRLARSGDSLRLNTNTTSKLEPDASMLGRRQALDQALNRWFAMFCLFNRKLDHIRTSSDSSLNLLVEMQWLVCKVWTANCFSKDETAYDAHLNRFRAIVDLAREAERATQRGLETSDESSVTGGFTVEMGYGPLLAFVVLKCRCLPLRLEALELLQSVSLPRESGWDHDLLAAQGRRVIEIEHGLELPLHIRWIEFVDQEGALPTEERLIKDLLMTPDPIVDRRSPEGTKTAPRKITFFLNDANGQGLTTRDEYWGLQLKMQ